MRPALLAALGLLAAPAAPAAEPCEAAALELRALAQSAQSAGAPLAAGAASGIADAIEGKTAAPAAAIEPAFAPKLKALKARHLDLLLKSWSALGTKGLWREQIALHGPLAALGGTEDPKARKALGMADVPGVGWCWVLRTPHYEITTSLAFRDQAGIAEAAEDLYEAFTTLFKPYTRLLETRNRLGIHFFDTSEQYQAFHQATGRTPTNAYGYYLGNADLQKSICCFHANEGRGRVFLFHEGCHQLHDRLLQTLRGCRPWVLEGLGTYFETLARKDGKLALGPAGDLRSWEAPARTGLATLLDFGPEAWVAESVKQGAGFKAQYRQAALLVAFLLEGEEGRFRDRLFKEILLKPGKGSPKDVEALFGMTLEELTRKYEAFGARHFP